MRDLKSYPSYREVQRAQAEAKVKAERIFEVGDLFPDQSVAFDERWSYGHYHPPEYVAELRTEPLKRNWLEGNWDESPRRNRRAAACVQGG